MLEAFGEAHPIVDTSAYVHARAVLIGAVSIGPLASVWPNATLRGDEAAIHIGARTNVQDGVVMHADNRLSAVVIEEQVTVGHNATVHGAHVEANCVIGMGAVILNEARIGSWSLVGAGALVTSRTIIPPRSLVLGTPARVVRELTDSELREITFAWQRYVELVGRYRGV